MIWIGWRLMNRFLRKKLLVLFLLCWFLVSCYPNRLVNGITQTVTPGATATASKTPPPIATFTPTPFQLVLPARTLSPQESENALLELLRTNGNCTGKCIAGIRPDEMTVQEAIHIMSQWGMMSIGEYNPGKTNVNNEPGQLYGKVGVYLSITTWKKKFETIDNVSFHIQNIGGGRIETDLWSENHDIWKGFRIDNLLKSYGIPSYVGFRFEGMSSVGAVRYISEIQYQDLQIAINSQSIALYDGENVFLCMTKDPHTLSMEIYPETPLDTRKRHALATWQSLSGADLEAFYQMFTNDAEACIKTTGKIPSGG